MRKRPNPPRCDLTSSDEDRPNTDEPAPAPAADGPPAAADSPRPATDAPEPDVEPTLTGQVGRTKDAFQGLVNAHLALLRTELGEILGQITKMATFGGLAFALLLTMVNMLYIGGFLFTGEWLFGSMGWGLAQGVFFAISLAAVLILFMLGGGGGQAAVAFLLAAVLTVLLAIVLGTNWAYNTFVYIGQQLPFPFNSGTMVSSIVGLVVGAVLLGILLYRVLGRSGANIGLLLGALLGAILGFVIGSAPWTWPPAWGFAICIGLIVWPLINYAITWPRLDLEEYFAHLTPKETIAAVTETREWLQNQAQSRLPTRGKQ